MLGDGAKMTVTGCGRAAVEFEAAATPGAPELSAGKSCATTTAAASASVGAPRGLRVQIMRADAPAWPTAAQERSLRASERFWCELPPVSGAAGGAAAGGAGPQRFALARCPACADCLRRLGFLCGGGGSSGGGAGAAVQLWKMRAQARAAGAYAASPWAEGTVAVGCAPAAAAANC